MASVVEERRAVAAEFELRAASKGVRRFEGYAARFETPADIGGAFVEQIATGAFKKTLSDKADVRMLLNHDGAPFARTKSGTMRLTEDKSGLYVDADLDESSPAVRSLTSAIERGDLDQMSFGFQTVQDEMLDREEELPLRTLREVKLFDVSPVTYPAYDGTTAMVRAARAALERRGYELPLSKAEREAADYESALRLIAQTSPDGDIDPEQVRAAIKTLDEFIQRAEPSTPTEPEHSLDLELSRALRDKRRRQIALLSA